ncbi:MAG: DUF1304 domain-containing protein [Archangium sp.]
MHIAAIVVAGLVAVLHLYFLTLEMFLWQKAIGLKTFGNTPEKAATMAVLAGNQGLYNGFLSAGLIWGIAHPDASFGVQLVRFFLGCVIVAGVYGAATVSKRILFVQAVPAIIGLGLTFL